MGEKEACPDQTALLDIPEDLEPDLNKTCWIQRVPRKLRKVKEAAYTPTLVSIGPFHHGKPALKAMEHHKAKYYQKFWERDFCKHIKENDVIRDFTEELGGHRGQRIRNSYAGTFDQPVNDVGHSCFLEVILRDSCFIFELFLRNKENQISHADYILKTPWLRNAIELDLIMVENQVPYFVFTELFDFILEKQPVNFHIPPYLSKHQKESERHQFIMNMTCEFFRGYYRYGKVTSESVGFPNDELKNIKHFTDLVRKFMHPNNYSGIPGDARCLYSAKELDRAGVEFVSCSNKFLTDIQFIKKGKILKLPRFQIEDNTECLLRNVMALEQCLYPYEADICNYISLLDQLINTDEDVEFLVKKKVVHNWLGSNKEVADLINTLGKEIGVTSFCYADICKQLNRVHENCWNVAKATLKRVYFKDIWTGSSTIVAFVVLIFSIVSVIATIKDSFI